MSPKKRKSGEEEQYYEIIKEKLGELFKERGVSVYLEITSRGVFSDRLKSRIPSGRDIIFLFLKKAAPDITGFIEGSSLSRFIVVEVKKEKIELDDIYQLRKYADLFDARFAFLVSLKPIPEEIKRLSKTVYTLLAGSSIYDAFVLAQFDEHNKQFVEWFKENPFSESIGKV